MILGLIYASYFRFIDWALQKIHPQRWAFFPENKTFLLLFFVLMTAFIVYFAQQQETVYFWDSGGYWMSAVETSRLFFEQPFRGLFVVLDSMAISDYNHFPGFLLSFPLRFIGEDFGVFLWAVFALFVFPALLIAYKLILFVLNQEKIYLENNQKIMLFYFLGTCPLWYKALFLGYSAALGLVFFSLLWFYFTKEQMKLLLKNHFFFSWLGFFYF